MAVLPKVGSRAAQPGYRISFVKHETDTTMASTPAVERKDAVFLPIVIRSSCRSATMQPAKNCHPRVGAKKKAKV
jgi:hypothetical protein